MIITFHSSHMTTFEQSDWTATIVAAGTSGTIRKLPDPSSSREGAGPPDYHDRQIE